MSGKRTDSSSPAAAVLRPIASVIQAITGPWTRENGWSWIKLILFVLTVWWFFIQPFRIPSQSMFPTLNGDPGFSTGQLHQVEASERGFQIQGSCAGEFGPEVILAG